MILQEEFVDLSTPTGPMRTYVYRPVAPGRYPGLVLFSEIFQRTSPIKRTAALMAGHGFVVAVPEIFHELEEVGCELAYDNAGTEKGNKDKIGKPVTAYDADARAVIEYLKNNPHCTGKLGSMGICVGGHLSFRCSMNPEILAGVCLYATDIHKRSLGLGGDNSLDRVAAGELKAEMQMFWGRQDPHVPAEGRLLIYKTLTEANCKFNWTEFNTGQHAFVRDEGYRYDPALAMTVYRMSLDIFYRKLGEGDLPVADAQKGPGETRH